MGRARLFRDLPIFKALKGAVKITPKQRNRTLIEMSLSITSIDLDYASGVFKTHGWMILKWNDPRNSWDPLDYNGEISIPLPFSSAWSPEVILHNAVEEKFAYRTLGIVL